MEQLLKITTIPIQYELRIQNARLEYSQSTAQVEISRDKGRLQIKSSPAKLNIDSFEMRNSIVPTPARALKQYAEKGIQATYEASARMAQNGQLLLKAKIGEDVLGQIFSDNLAASMPSGDFVLDFSPSEPINLEYEPGELTIRYEMDKLNFDLKVSNGNFEFIPGDIELVITQYPDVKIEYIGDPLYVPPSSAPDYEPLDIKV